LGIGVSKEWHGSDEGATVEIDNVLGDECEEKRGEGIQTNGSISKHGRVNIPQGDVAMDYGHEKN
jgi:hypothetical protein